MTIREKLQSVKASVSMVDLLKLHGISVSSVADTQISCPFHGADIHPSARVFPATNTIFCWTCHQMWDVVAAEMQFSGTEFNEAVEFLALKFNVSVASHSAELNKFYSQVAKYQYGDLKQAQTQSLDLAYRFRAYYFSIPDWQVVRHLVEYFWQEYDSIVASELSPAQQLDQVLEWYSKAYSMISMQAHSIPQLSNQSQGTVETTIDDDVGADEDL
jgi:hypothetical protein